MLLNLMHMNEWVREGCTSVSHHIFIAHIECIYYKNIINIYNYQSINHKHYFLSQENLTQLFSGKTD